MSNTSKDSLTCDVIDMIMDSYLDRSEDTVIYCDLSGRSLTKAQFRNLLKSDEHFLREEFGMLRRKLQVTAEFASEIVSTTIMPVQRRILAKAIFDFCQNRATYEPDKVFSDFLKANSILLQLCDYEEIQLIVEMLKFEHDLFILAPSMADFETLKLG